MSGTDRARLAAIAGALADSGNARTAMLGRALAGRSRAAVGLDDVANAPEWLTRPVDERRRLGHREALAAIAPALEASVDGAWLGGLAKVAGEAELDRAMTVHTPMVLPVFGGAELDIVAGALLRAAAPPALRDFAATDAGRRIDPATANSALALVL